MPNLRYTIFYVKTNVLQDLLIRLIVPLIMLARVMYFLTDFTVLTPKVF